MCRHEVWLFQLLAISGGRLVVGIRRSGFGRTAGQSVYSATSCLPLSVRFLVAKSFTVESVCNQKKKLFVFHVIVIVDETGLCCSLLFHTCNCSRELLTPFIFCFYPCAAGFLRFQNKLLTCLKRLSFAIVCSLGC